MCEVFQELPEEKQLRIINAAMEVFSQNDYKRASTDDIAAKAGISKGSLFYYFKNKKSLYVYLYNYVGSMVREQVADKEFFEITDFFELLFYGAKCKMHLVDKNPYIMDFVIRCFYSQDETVSGETDKISTGYIDNSFETYFCNIDFSKFREGANPLKVYQMLVWMTDGYLNEKRRKGGPLVLEELMSEFSQWADMMKKILYKEEYLHE